MLCCYHFVFTQNVLSYLLSILHCATESMNYLFWTNVFRMKIDLNLFPHYIFALVGLEHWKWIKEYQKMTSQITMTRFFLKKWMGYLCLLNCLIYLWVLAISNTNKTFFGILNLTHLNIFQNEISFWTKFSNSVHSVICNQFEIPVDQNHFISTFSLGLLKHFIS